MGLERMRKAIAKEPTYNHVGEEAPGVKGELARWRATRALASNSAAGARLASLPQKHRR
jgi:hypothetical protein